MRKATISAEQARNLLSYCQDTGKLTWKITRTFTATAGKEAGFIGDSGYVKVKVMGSYFAGHRIAWLIHYGHWPNGVIDHLNGIRSDNRILNLRDTSALVNSQNRRKQGRRGCGLLGACFNKKLGKYQAAIRIGGKIRHIGLFDSAEQAHAAYVAEKRINHEGCTI